MARRKEACPRRLDRRQLAASCRIQLYGIKAPPLAARAVWRCTNIHPGTPGIRFAAPVGRAALRAGPQMPADGTPDPSLIRSRLPTSASMVTKAAVHGARLPRRLRRLATDQAPDEAGGAKLDLCCFSGNGYSLARDTAINAA